MTGNWADSVDDDDVSVDDLQKRLGGFAAPASSTDSSSSTTTKTAQSPAAASLASRLGGFAPDSSSPAPAAAADNRGRLNANAPIFGKALAGVKTQMPESASAPAPAAAPAAAASTPATSSAPSSEPPKMEGEADQSKSVDMDQASGLISNDFQVEVKLADLQADPNSPLYSVKTFEELPIHPDLLKGIYAAGFKKPSKIQEKALPLLLANPPQNLIGQSQSGTGKTAAFTVNMLSRVDPALMTPQAICLTPSRELARQTQEVIDRLAQFTQVKTRLIVPQSWTRRDKFTEQIIIGTPGSVLDLVGRRLFDLKQMRVFVLDEADMMIALQGLGEQTFRIKKLMPEVVQNVLFSATFPEEVQQFARLFAPLANEIFLKQEEVSVDAIKQMYLECDGEAGKVDALARLYDAMTIGQSIVFCRKKSTADEIEARLKADGHLVASLHGDKDPAERDALLDSFRDGKTKVLITTNVIARGIDIQQVNMVVNYDVPDMGPEGGFAPDIETYIHRIGRTGRFGRKGCSVTFVHDDRSRADVFEIMERTSRQMKKIVIDQNDDDLEQLSKALKAIMKGPA